MIISTLSSNKLMFVGTGRFKHQIPVKNMSDDTLCKQIIFDCDVGTDDAWALLMLLRAEEEFNIKVVAITCTHGNTSLENVAINVLRVLETVDRLDVSS